MLKERVDSGGCNSGAGSDAAANVSRCQGSKHRGNLERVTLTCMLTGEPVLPPAAGLQRSGGSLR